VPPPSAPAPPASTFTQVGLASWYGNAHAGRRTASGEPFDPGALTAAHRTLPLGAVVRVTNLANRRSVEVRINDRGPADLSRVIDLSKRAAEDLDFTADGTTRVRIELIRSSP
jgi:rare lipoprotein A